MSAIEKGRILPPFTVLCQSQYGPNHKPISAGLSECRVLKLWTEVASVGRELKDVILGHVMRLS
jgi:hypothetical protein